MVDVIGSALTSVAAAEKVRGPVAKVAQIDGPQRFSNMVSAASDTVKTVQPTSAAEVPKVADVEARERARRALQLETANPVKPAQGGDSILDGLQKLRGIFDKQQARVNGVMAGSANDMNSLMKIQMEVVNYTLLVDVTSKLTGKSTQAFESLLKGQ